MLSYEHKRQKLATRAVFLSRVARVLAPVLHRVLHALHADENERE